MTGHEIKTHLDILSDDETILFIEWHDIVCTVLTWTPPLHTPRPTCLQLAVSGGGRRGNL